MPVVLRDTDGDAGTSIIESIPVPKQLGYVSHSVRAQDQGLLDKLSTAHVV